MTKKLKLPSKKNKRLNDIVNKIKSSCGEKQKILLEELKEGYAIFEKRGYNIYYFKKFYKELSENRRKKFNEYLIGKSLEDKIQ